MKPDKVLCYGKIRPSLVFLPSKGTFTFLKAYLVLLLGLLIEDKWLYTGVDSS